MAKKLDKIVVIDVESTCWNGKYEQGRQQNEIIEIGVCAINLTTMSPEKSEGILVSPQKSTVSRFCTDLTTITQEMLDKDGIAFHEACSILSSKYNTNNRAWMSWGDYDRRQFDRQCKQCNIQYPFGPTHINMKNLFAVNMSLSREVGMDAALGMLKMDLEGTHHRGVDDARNIAKIACKVLKTTRFHS